MRRIIKITGAVAQALRDGTKSEHRLPWLIPEAQAVQIGDTVEFVEIGFHGQTTFVALKTVASLQKQRMEDISDDQITAEGYVNWSVMAYQWNSTFKAKECSWDVNPEILVIRLENQP